MHIRSCVLCVSLSSTELPSLLEVSAVRLTISLLSACFYDRRKFGFVFYNVQALPARLSQWSTTSARCVAPPVNLFIVTPVRQSEKIVYPRAKPRAVCRLRTVCTPHAQPGPQRGRLRSPLKTPCEKLAPLKNAACIRRAQETSAHNTDATKLVAGRGDALFVLAALVW